MDVQLDQAAIDRFHSSTQRSESGCLVWSGSLDGAGYGKFAVGKKLLVASRLAWTIKHGPIPAGIEVCHRCDNPACVDTEHLFLGTHKENMRDAFAKGRLFSKAYAGTCLKGHPFDPATAVKVKQRKPSGRVVTKLKCRTCIKLKSARTRLRARTLRTSHSQ